MSYREPSPHDNLSTLSDREKIYLTNSVGKTYDLDDSRKCTVQSVNLDAQTVTCSINGNIEIIPLSDFHDELAMGGSKSRKHRSNKRKGKKSYRKKKYGKSKKIRRFRRSVKSRR
jgi:hypothetical protein